MEPSSETAQERTDGREEQGETAILNWRTIILTAIVLATIESVVVMYSDVSRVDRHYGYLLEVTAYAFVASIWIASLFLFTLTVRAVRKLSSKVLRTLLLVGIFTCLLPIQLFLLSSLAYFCKHGSFLAFQIASFVLHNWWQLAFHALQTFPLEFGIAVMATATISAVTLLAAMKSARNTADRAISPRIAGFLCVVLAGAFLHVAFEDRAVLTEKAHPLVTLISSVFPQQSLEPSGLLVRNLEPRSIPKVVTKRHDLNTPVIVIMLESMRSDLAFQNPSPVPFMKSLIEESFFFDKAYATSSHSNYSDVSVWYAQYPLRTPYLREFAKDDEWRDSSIFRVFKDLGYKTGYISSQNEKWGGMIHWLKVPEVDFFYHSEDFHGKTWENWDDKRGLVHLIVTRIATAGKIEDTETIAVAEKWIDRLADKQRFFLGMNLQNTHYSYVIPEGGKEPFQPSVIDFPTPFASWPRERVVDVRNRYLNAVFNVDLIMKRFVDFLKSQGIWDNCFFVLLGDSGEAFYEHGYANHAGGMHDEVMRTFCLIKPPKGQAVHAVEGSVSHIDIIPGILDLMGIPQPESFQGVSPFGNPKRRPIFMHSNVIVDQDGVILWPWKLLVSRRPEATEQLYNLEEDPLEQVNEVGLFPDAASDLRNKLNEWRRTQLTYYGNPLLFRSFYPPKVH